MTDPDRSENRALQAIRNYYEQIQALEAIAPEQLASQSMAEQFSHQNSLRSYQQGLLAATRQLEEYEQYHALQISDHEAVTKDLQRENLNNLHPDTVVTRDIIAELSERARQMYKVNSLLGSTPKQ